MIGRIIFNVIGQLQNRTCTFWAFHTS